MAVIFGNEVGDRYNLKFAGSARDFYALAEEAADIVRDALGPSAPLFTTAIADVADLGQVPDSPGLSFWSVNVFRGITFGDAFEQIRRRTSKPALISEFGVDAWDASRLVEDAEAQAKGLRILLGLLHLELARPGSALIGGVWFGFTDDVAVRLTPWGAGTRVDVRAVSREGQSDMGRNARRIRRYLAALQ